VITFLSVEIRIIEDGECCKGGGKGRVDQIRKGLNENPGLITALVSVIRKGGGEWKGAREKALGKMWNIACGGTELARKLHDYPALMARLEKVKGLSGDANKNTRDKPSEIITYISQLISQLTPTDKELSKVHKELRDAQKRLSESWNKLCEATKRGRRVWGNAAGARRSLGEAQ